MTKKLSHEEFILQSKSVHGNKYDYSKSVYDGAATKVIITCPVHGDFLQQAREHKKGKGCNKCANAIRGIKTGLSKKLTTKVFVTRAIETHNDTYDYSLVKYVGMHVPVKIICKKHGVFLQKPHVHIGKEKCGCPKCGLGNNSRVEKIWLDIKGIPEEYRQHCIVINSKRYFVDGFDPKTNTIYEFYGDMWHGNPDKFDSKKINMFKNKTFGDLHQATIIRENVLKAAGYNIVSIWENDFRREVSNEI